MNKEFDPTVLKQAASAIAESFAENSVKKAKDNKIKDDLKNLINDVPTIRCDECGHHVFSDGIVLKRFSPITSPTGEDMVVPVQVYSCMKCHHVNREWLPSYAISDVQNVDKNGLPTY